MQTPLSGESLSTLMLQLLPAPPERVCVSTVCVSRVCMRASACCAPFYVSMHASVSG